MPALKREKVDKEHAAQAALSQPVAERERRRAGRWRQYPCPRCAGRPPGGDAAHAPVAMDRIPSIATESASG